MNEPDFKSWEAELQRLKPVPPSEGFLTRLTRALPSTDTEATPAPPIRWRITGKWRWLRWLAPATAIILAAAGFLLWTSAQPKRASQTPSPVPSVAPALTADAVEIDKSQVASFDALGRLPDGAPVRLHCREWTDKVIVRDSAKGIVIEQRTPRLEIISVSFETY